MKGQRPLLITFFVVQLALLAGIAFTAVYSYKTYQQTIKNTDNSDRALLNSLSARLGQVQADLFQIKAKIGAQTPN